MQFTTRKPTGKASFPLILLAGVEGGGKTWAAVETSAMTQVDRTFFVEIGEGTADEYGAVPGADYEIIDTDGTIGQIRQAIKWASDQPAAEGKHNLLVVDSASELWSLLSDEAQGEANRRAKRKGRRVSDDGAPISMDLWNRATETWEGIIAQLHRFPGPVILTARLELVTVMDDGQPTGQKDYKIQAQKRLPYRVQVIVQARQPRQWTMTKVVTTNPQLALEPGQERTFNDFSVPKLLEAMGVVPDMPASTFTHARTDGSLSDEKQDQREQAAAQQQEKEARSEDLRRWADSLLSFEKDGDSEMVRRGMEWAQSHKDREKWDMAKKVLDRMAPTPEEAQGNAQQVLDAEVVSDAA